MRARDGSQRNHEILPYSSDVQPLLFGACNDWMISVLSYLTLQSICRFDSAVTNTTARVTWLRSLRVSNHGSVDEHMHSNESMRWLEKRGIRPESLMVMDDRWEAERINGTSLLGLNIASLRCISLRNCDIGDTEVISLAHGCPNLSEICLSGCDRVCNEGLVALAKFNHQLISIDIGECYKITDKGLKAFTNFRSQLNSVSIPDRLQISEIVKIRLACCTKVTDIGISALAKSCPQLNNIDLSCCNKVLM